MAEKFKLSVSDFTGIIRTPGQTLGKVMNDINWIPMFLILILAIGIFSYIAFPAKMAKMVEDPHMAELMGQDRADYFVDTSPFARLMGSFITLFMLILSIVFGAFFLYLFFGIGGSDGLYGNYFALVTHASIIDVFFPSLLSTIALMLGISFAKLGTPLLTLFAPESNTFIALLLGSINVFSIWYHIAIAAGISVFSQMGFRKCVLISFIYFIFKTSIGVASSYMLIKITSAM
jgi:hypothetical protein